VASMGSILFNFSINSGEMMIISESSMAINVNSMISGCERKKESDSLKIRE